MYDIDLLYREYSKDIYAHLLYLTHDETLSQDLLQETFLQAIKSISTFKGNSSIKTWLFSIARYSWIAHLRKNKIRKLQVQVGHPVVDSAPIINLGYEWSHRLCP